jgi:hypothetical protein
MMSSLQQRFGGDSNGVLQETLSPQSASARVPSVMSSSPSAQKMNLIQYADLARATRDLRHSIELVATTADTMRRILKSFQGNRVNSECEIMEDDCDINLGIQLMSKLAQSHTLLSGCLSKEVEVPFFADVEIVHAAAIGEQNKNEQKLKSLAKLLKDTENESMKVRRAKKIDLSAYQQSLSVLNSIASEIRRVEGLNSVIGDVVAERRYPFVLERCRVMFKATAKAILQMEKDISNALTVYSDSKIVKELMDEQLAPKASSPCSSSTSLQYAVHRYTDNSRDPQVL